MSRLFSGTSFDRPPTCDRCGKPQLQCRCLTLPPKKKNTTTLSTGLTLTPQNATPPKDQRALIRIEKRKANREVTLITGLDHPANDLPMLLTALKATLGCGGSVQGRAIELQGRHAAKVAEMLTQKQIKNRIA